MPTIGQVGSVKWHKNRTTGKWDVVIFDQTGGEQEYSADTLEDAMDAAQAGVEALLPFGARMCFSGTVLYIDDN